MPHPQWSTYWALFWAGLILLLTLFPGPPITSPPEDLPQTLCLICGEIGTADAILNLLLFVPLGIGLISATASPWRGLALVVTLTVTIEILQGAIPGRHQSLGDVVYNTVGGGAGIALVAVGKPLLWPGTRGARLLTLASGTVAATLLLLAGVMLAPSFPDTVYYGQWNADLHYMEAYQGQVFDATLGSMLLPSRRTSDPEGAVKLVRAGAPLEALAMAGPAPRALAPLVSIFDESQVEIAVLGADVDDLVLRLRYRANDFRLDRPDLRVRGAFAAVQAGDTINLGAERTKEGYTLRLNEQEYPQLGHTPGEGWSLLLHPEHTAPWMDNALNAVWVAAPLVLAGWWAPGLGWAAVALSLSLSGMGAAALLGPLTGVAQLEILAAFGGVVLGLLFKKTLSGARTMSPLYASVTHEKATPKTCSDNRSE